MRGMYTVRFAKTTFTAANGDYDFCELNPAADEPIELCAFDIGNKTEVTDAQEEMVRFQVIRMEGATLTSGNGSSTTPEPTTDGDEAASFTAETVASTIATTTGTTRIIWESTFNIRSPQPLWIPPEYRATCRGATDNVLIVRMVDALADDADLSGTFWVKQLS